MAIAIGSRVRVKGNVGFTYLAEPKIAIVQEGEAVPCWVMCRKKGCKEWPTLITEDGIPLYHVSECEMEEII